MQKEETAHLPTPQINHYGVRLDHWCNIFASSFQYLQLVVCQIIIFQARDGFEKPETFFIPQKRLGKAWANIFASFEGSSDRI